MSKWILAAGAAVIAFASPTLADPGGNKGKGGNQNQAKAQKADHGGGKAGGQANIDRRGGGGDMRVAQGNRGNGGDRIKAKGRGDDFARGGGKGDRVKIKGGSDDRAFARDDGNRGKIKGRGDDGLRIVNRDGDRFDGSRLVRFESDERGFRRISGNCAGAPPGLVGKNEFCMPPGQYKKIGTRLPAAFASQTLDGPFSQWYRDDDRYFYRNDGDYIYRVNRDGGLIDALFPSLDRDYSYYPIGMNYPSAFNFYNVPNQYQSFYPDGGGYNYRYGDGAIYQVNQSNNAIQSIVQLLAGDLGVGQRMPLNYGAYNVPLSYRDRYYDTPQAMYRYNDGYIYQADPTTQLITAVISALV